MKNAEKKTVYSIILAAGKGERMGNLQKQFLRVNKKPILFYSLDVFMRCKDIAGLILVVPESKVTYTQRLVMKKYGKRGKTIDIIPGGTTRRFSSLAGLEYIKKNKYPCSHVVFHDGVRPLLSVKLISSVIEEGKKYGAAVAASKALNVIGHVRGGCIVEAFNANTVYNTQTPHCYDFGLIMKAHTSEVNDTHERNAYENIELVHALGATIKIVETFYRNMKLTYPQDLIPLQALLKAQEKNEDFLLLK